MSNNDPVRQNFLSVPDTHVNMIFMVLYARKLKDQAKAFSGSTHHE